MTLFEFIAAHEAPHQFIEECLANKHSADEAETCRDLYNETSFWEGLHPDDDFEKIIDKMVDSLIKDLV